ncbi:C40 family peptidase [Paenibacillus lignilyticus]|uniref:C40 family peptidase n=1 Tax=Paenibacillus lignilyticus TaxID=1172615 RepID=A0ABS5CC56_9BACL|nr:C40 family peptidase [Paenibacillus lignilyticus]MBP3963297.1 C40 family peptidase [Paenibacillus lignilyticus]
MTNTLAHKRLNKKLLNLTLSLSIAIGGGSMLFTPDPTHAATVTKTITTTNPASAVNSSIVNDIIATGKQYLGVDYKYGAKTTTTSVFDCSSFVQYIFKQHGIDLPRTSRQQAKVGTKVTKDQLQPGDLVFSDTNRDGVINHVSLYIGDDKLLQTYRVGVGVTVSKFSGSSWDKTFVTARHVITGDNTDNTGENGNTDNSGDNGSIDDGNTGDNNDNDGTIDDTQPEQADESAAPTQSSGNSGHYNRNR